MITGTYPGDVSLQYDIPGANTYDWSSTPATTLSSSWAVWFEPVNPAAGPGSFSGVTQARVASGINHAAQQRDSDLTLAAGLLFGIGGSALVAAVQEALHD